MLPRGAMRLCFLKGAKKKKKSVSALLSSSSTLLDCLFPSYSAFIRPFCLPQGSSPGSFDPLASTSASQRGFPVCCTSPPAAGSHFLFLKVKRDHLDSVELNSFRKLNKPIPKLKGSGGQVANKTKASMWLC